MTGKRRTDVDKMYDFYKQGYTMAQVAEVFGGSKQSVHRLFKSRGLPTLSRKLIIPKEMLNHEDMHKM